MYGKLWLSDLNCSSHTNPSYYWQTSLRLNTFYRNYCFCLEKFDRMTNGCHRCIQNFTNFQAQQMICINAIVIYLLNIEERLLGLRLGCDQNLSTTCMFHIGFLYYKAVTE